MTDLEHLLTLARQKGTDSTFLAWTRLQPSVLGGDFDQWFHGEGRSICAHIRRARSAGTAHKPPYSAIPLSDAQHRVQSIQGEAACLERFLGGKWTALEAKAEFDRLLVEHLERWVGS